MLIRSFFEKLKKKNRRKGSMLIYATKKSDHPMVAEK